MTAMNFAIRSQFVHLPYEGTSRDLVMWRNLCFYYSTLAFLYYTKIYKLFLFYFCFRLEDMDGVGRFLLTDPFKGHVRPQ